MPGHYHGLWFCELNLACTVTVLESANQLKHQGVDLHFSLLNSMKKYCANVRALFDKCCASVTQICSIVCGGQGIISSIMKHCLHTEVALGMLK